MINYNCPDFYNAYKIYSYLAELKILHPYVFYDDVQISSIFGCFPSAIWNGGSYLLDGSITQNIMRDMVKLYNEAMNMPIRFTFTNPLINEKQCYDTYCNLIVENAHNGNNEILVVSPVLEEYLRKNYPNYKYIRSIIADNNEQFFDSEKYHMIVMPRAYNNNWEYLDTIPNNVRTKVEFLCNDPCPDNCPRLKSHYLDFAKTQLNYEYYDECRCSMTEVKGAFPYAFAKQQKAYISRDMILNNYLPKGFNQFKLSGRGDNGVIINFVVEHLIKPEYQLDIRIDLINLFL